MCSACCTFADCACSILLFSFRSFSFFYKSRTCSWAISRGTELLTVYCNLHSSRYCVLFYSCKTSIYLHFCLLDYYMLAHLLVIVDRAFTTLLLSFCSTSNLLCRSFVACTAVVYFCVSDCISCYNCVLCVSASC